MEHLYLNKLHKSKKFDDFYFYVDSFIFYLNKKIHSTTD